MPNAMGRPGQDPLLPIVTSPILPPRRVLVSGTCVTLKVRRFRSIRFSLWSVPPSEAGLLRQGLLPSGCPFWSGACCPPGCPEVAAVSPGPPQRVGCKLLLSTGRGPPARPLPWEALCCVGPLRDAPSPLVLPSVDSSPRHLITAYALPPSAALPRSVVAGERLGRRGCCWLLFLL